MSSSSYLVRKQSLEITPRKTLGNLIFDHQKYALLEVQTFYGTTNSYLQEKLPWGNEFHRQLGCLNPLKRDKKFEVSLIQSIINALLPKVSVNEVVD